MLCRKSQVLRQNRAANFEFQKNIFRKSSLSHSALSSFSALPLFLFLSLYGSSGSSPSSLHFVLWISQLLARKFRLLFRFRFWLTRRFVWIDLGTPRDSIHKRATRREKKTRRKKINSEAAPFFRRQV
uniref:Uncharacterized protein n=1 Tax=Salix viminalis TaxID=40686 RepID=A0A6N2KZB0_SALVM